MELHKMRRNYFISALAVLISLASFGVAMAQTPQSLVDQVSISQYTKYQGDIQQMGLGLYGGPSYNQGYRCRHNAISSDTTPTEALGFLEANLYLNDQFTSMNSLSVNPAQSIWKNVVATLPGVDPDPAVRNKIYIISGHYDHPEYNGNAPGGDDNASGTAGVLEAARVMSKYQFKSTIVFIGWGGEEGWMKGSWDYVNNVVKKNYGSGADPNHLNVAGMLNLDMILAPFNALAPNAPLDLDIGTRVEYPECAAWANKFRTAGAKYAPSIQIDATHGSDYYEWYASDQGPFMSGESGFRYPGLMIAENTCNEIWSGSNPWYHQSGDASDLPAGARYDYQFATNIVKIAVGMIAEEAQVVPGIVWKGGIGSDPTNWGVAANWSPGDFAPDGPRSKVIFGDQSGGYDTVDMISKGRSVGSLVFTASASTTIQSTGGYSLTLDNSGYVSTVEVAGTHTISAPVVLDNNAIISGTGTLNLTGGISGNYSLSVISGTLNASSIVVDTLNVGTTGATTVPEPSILALIGIVAIGLLVYAGSRVLRVGSPRSSE
jgi:hypothetical protein